MKFFCLLILYWKMEIRKASPVSQENREHLFAIHLAPNRKTGPTLPTSFLREVQLVLYTSQNISGHASSILGQHFWYVIALVPFACLALPLNCKRFSCIMLAWVMLLARNFHIKNSFSVPFKNTCKKMVQDCS